MKSIVTFFALLAFSFSAFGNELVDKQLAIQFLKASRIEQGINISIDTYSQQRFQGIPQADQTELNKLMRQVMGWDAVKDRLAEIVIGLYTRAELKAAIAFMKTPLGASFTAKNDQFSGQFSSLITHNLQKFMEEHPIGANPAVKPDVPEAVHPLP